jgi:predicted DCC family thiol-disulfide oxidoreductase YuxK
MGVESFSTSHKCLLVYDGECRLCVTAKEGLERHGTGNGIKLVRMIPYQSEEAQQVLGATYRPGRPEAAFLVHPNGDIASGLDAFLPLLPGLRGGRLIGTLLAVPIMKPIAYALYRLIARHRYRLFGAVSCPSVPKCVGPQHPRH